MKVMCLGLLLLCGCTAFDRQVAVDGLKAGFNEAPPPSHQPSGSWGDDLKTLAISTIAYVLGSAGKGAVRKYAGNKG